MKHAKTSQLQIRVSPAQKAKIKSLAHWAKLDLSSYVLSKVLPPVFSEFETLLSQLKTSAKTTSTLAALNDFLVARKKSDFPESLESQKVFELTALLANQVAAMVEFTAAKLGVAPPSWTGKIEPLGDPYFASGLDSLRLHLLTSSPPAFRKRNLFVDTTVGGRI